MSNHQEIVDQDNIATDNTNNFKNNKQLDNNKSLQKNNNNNNTVSIKIITKKNLYYHHSYELCDFSQIDPLFVIPLQQNTQINLEENILITTNKKKKIKYLTIKKKIEQVYNIPVNQQILFQFVTRTNGSFRPHDKIVNTIVNSVDNSVDHVEKDDNSSFLEFDDFEREYLFYVYNREEEDLHLQKLLQNSLQNEEENKEEKILLFIKIYNAKEHSLQFLDTLFVNENLTFHEIIDDLNILLESHNFTKIVKVDMSQNNQESTQINYSYNIYEEVYPSRIDLCNFDHRLSHEAELIDGDVIILQNNDFVKDCKDFYLQNIKSSLKKLYTNNNCDNHNGDNIPVDNTIDNNTLQKIDNNIDNTLQQILHKNIHLPNLLLEYIHYNLNLTEKIDNDTTTVDNNNENVNNNNCDPDDNIFTCQWFYKMLGKFDQFFIEELKKNNFKLILELIKIRRQWLGVSLDFPIFIKYRLKQPALSILAENNNVEMAKFLVKNYKLDINILCKRRTKSNGIYYSQNPLFWAAEKGNFEMVKFLLNYGAYKDSSLKYSQFTDSSTIAKEKKHLEIAKYIKLFNYDQYLIQKQFKKMNYLFDIKMIV
ncbi:hypothetical protein ABK040_007340 [Willaertia magna]